FTALSSLSTNDLIWSRVTACISKVPRSGSRCFANWPFILSASPQQRFFRHANHSAYHSETVLPAWAGTAPRPRSESEIIFATRFAIAHDGQAGSFLAACFSGVPFTHGGTFAIGYGLRPCPGSETRASQTFRSAFHCGDPVAGRAMVSPHQIKTA